MKKYGDKQQGKVLAPDDKNVMRRVAEQEGWTPQDQVELQEELADAPEEDNA